MHEAELFWKIVIYQVRTHVYKNANMFCLYFLKRDGFLYGYL